MELIPLLCERACRWASLRVDGELSELESALLDDHLGRCRSCRVFASGVEAVSASLAAARLERPAPLVLVIPSRRRPLRSAAAATLIAAAGIASLVGGLAASGQPTSAAKPVAMLQSADAPNELRKLRRWSLIDDGRVVRRNRHTPGESY
jgi:hypothetical protein